MPVPLVDAAAHGCLLFRVDDRVVAHFGGPWEQHEVAEYVESIARGEMATFAAVTSFASRQSPAVLQQLRDGFGLRDGTVLQLSVYEGSIVLHHQQSID